MKKPMLRLFTIAISCVVLFIGLIVFSLPNQTNKKNTICLSMIIKNEKNIIKDCLASVKGVIDYWVIIDTGSVDGTQEIVKEFMKDIPGELHERPWVHFAHNRNEALELSKSKAEYSLFIDADEKLIFTKEWNKKLKLGKDSYRAMVKEKGSAEYGKCFLVRNALDWQWKGVMHESLESSLPSTSEILSGLFIHSDTTLGARYKNPKKYLDDAAVLKKGLQEEPNNTRYQFYLAQCYVSAKEFGLALEEYEKRIAMGVGFEHEYFFSLYMLGRMQDVLRKPLETVIASYQKAHAYRPWRLEPLFYLGLIYAKTGSYILAYDTLKKATSTIGAPHDDFFIDSEIPWKLQHVLVDVCCKLGKAEEALQSCEKIILCEYAPQDLKEQIRKDKVKIREYFNKK